MQLHLLQEIDFHDHKSQKDHLKITLLAQESNDLSSRPNFTSLICRALVFCPFSADFFIHFVQVTQLSLCQALLVALGLAQSADGKARDEGLGFLQSNLADVSGWENEQLSPGMLHQLLYFIRSAIHIALTAYVITFELVLVKTGVLHQNKELFS